MKARPGTEVSRSSVGQSIVNITLMSYSPLRYVKSVSYVE